MQTEINQIVQQLFRQETLEQVSEEELEQFVKEFPYVNAAHLLLAKKKYGNGENAGEVLQHTALYITNPLLLQWLLDEKRFTTQTAFHFIEIPKQQSEEEKAMDVSGEEQIAVGNEEEPFTLLDPVVGIAPLTEEETERSNNFSSADSHHSKSVVELNEEAYDDAEANDTGSPGEETKIREVPVFQSYHTVDYFASLGIKLKQGELGDDKLGKQLRSFTEWLRSMKRLPQTSGAEDPAEQTVRIIAEHSIEEREVLTEAMAEVWVKQGNRQKASDIYRKLSLLNPAKSAYFAAKIDHL